MDTVDTKDVLTRMLRETFAIENVDLNLNTLRLLCCAIFASFSRADLKNNRLYKTASFAFLPQARIIPLKHLIALIHEKDSIPDLGLVVNARQ